MRCKEMTEDILRGLYIDEEKTTTEIAHLYDTNHTTVRNYLKKFNIKIRTNSQSQRIYNSTNKISKDILLDLYIECSKSQYTIGKELGFSQITIGNLLRFHNIPIRTKQNFGARNGMFGKTHTEESKQKIRDMHVKQFSKVGMREKFAINTCRQIAEGRTGKKYNKLENRVAEILTNDGLKFIRQYRVRTFSFDFFIPETNTLVEANGTFWHADKRFYNHEKLYQIQKKNVANDIKKMQCAKEEGFNLRIIWENDV